MRHACKAAGLSYLHEGSAHSESFLLVAPRLLPTALEASPGSQLCPAAQNCNRCLTLFCRSGTDSGIGLCQEKEHVADGDAQRKLQANLARSSRAPQSKARRWRKMPKIQNARLPLPSSSRTWLRKPPRKRLQRSAPQSQCISLSLGGSAPSWLCSAGDQLNLTTDGNDCGDITLT